MITKKKLHRAFLGGIQTQDLLLTGADILTKLTTGLAGVKRPI